MALSTPADRTRAGGRPGPAGPLTVLGTAFVVLLYAVGASAATMGSTTLRTAQAGRTRLLEHHGLTLPAALVVLAHAAGVVLLVAGVWAARRRGDGPLVRSQFGVAAVLGVVPGVWPGVTCAALAVLVLRSRWSHPG